MIAIDMKMPESCEECIMVKHGFPDYTDMYCMLLNAMKQIDYVGHAGTGYKPYRCPMKQIDDVKKAQKNEGELEGQITMDEMVGNKK